MENESYNSTTHSSKLMEEISKEEDTLDISTIDSEYDSGSDSSTIPTVSLLSAQDALALQARLEWINAIFGVDFLCEGKPMTKKGKGLSNIESYIAYEANISSCPSSQEKLGITISRIPLGCYVRHIEPGKEAENAGIIPGSVLIEINGIPLLGEPTHKALERLFEYDHYADVTPICMRFIKNKRLYTATLFSREGFGIIWAACGNFALVQRSYSFAQNSGVKRGCLIASVNGKNLRDVDHVGMAELLRQTYWKKEPIHLVLVYTPAASRVKRNGPALLRIKNKPSPSPFSFLQCTSPDPSQEPKIHASSSFTKVTKIAQLVAGGEPISQKLPTGLTRMHDILPKLDTTQLFHNFHSQTALVYCLSYYLHGYSLDDFISSQHYSKSQLSLAETLAIFEFTEIDEFLLQFVSLLGSCNKQDKHLLASKLVDCAIQDETFCLKLFFLLQSFANSQKNDSNLIYSETLQMLQSSLEENEKKNQTPSLDESESPFLHDTSPSYLEDQPSPAESTIQDDPPSPIQIESPNTNSSTTAKKKKKMFSFRRLRTKKDEKYKSTITTNSPKAEFESKTPPISPPPPPLTTKPSILKNATITTETSIINAPTDESTNHTFFNYLKNLESFIQRLNLLTDETNVLLRKSFPQKIIDLAHSLTASKQKALIEATTNFRNQLEQLNECFPILNPLAPSNHLLVLQPEDSFILPSYHIPLLLSTRYRPNDIRQEIMYKTKVEVLALRNANSTDNYVVQSIIAGVGQVTEKSSLSPYFDSTLHRWYKNNIFHFETSSSWGCPRTLLFKLMKNKSNVCLDDSFDHDVDVAYGWVDLTAVWKNKENTTLSHYETETRSIKLCSFEQEFDQQGFLLDDTTPEEGLELEIRLSTLTETMTNSNGIQSPLQSKCMLLYKHGDDLRQEMMAIQFIDTCRKLLKASGLDLKMRTFKCLPVGKDRGFIEWIPGCVPLSEVCQRPSNKVISSREGSLDESETSSKNENETPIETSRSFIPMSTIWFNQPFSLKEQIGQNLFGFGNRPKSKNPIQDFLRSVAYDPSAPYFISKAVMDNFIKSCAGYCIVSYLLGVGDRHLDNLLLHPEGFFLHCDFSFILGQDPKTYLPMRITEDMIVGMGGQESDNYAKFINLAGAAYIALRRHQNLRLLLSLIRPLITADLPDISLNQSAEDSFNALLYRFRLDLNDNDALTFIERLIESSISSKLAIAVDAIHSLGKHF